MLRLVECDPADPAARACLAAYYAELDARFPGGFKVEQSHHPDTADLVRPRGAFLVAFAGGEPVGCIALKGTPGWGELKRLWVAPALRGSGLGRRLTDHAEALAKELGYTLLRLDTNRALTGPIAMYRAWGWQEIARFNDDPYAEVFFEKRL